MECYFEVRVILDTDIVGKTFSMGTDEGEENDDPTLVTRKRSSHDADNDADNDADADDSTKRKVVVLSKKDDSSENEEGVIFSSLCKQSE